MTPKTITTREELLDYLKRHDTATLEFFKQCHKAFGKPEIVAYVRKQGGKESN